VLHKFGNIFNNNVVFIFIFIILNIKHIIFIQIITYIILVEILVSGVEGKICAFVCKYRFSYERKLEGKGGLFEQ